MAIGANSYGDPAEIAASVPLRAGKDGLFNATTRPTLTTVENRIDRVSAILNTYLAEAGFDIPVTQADAKLALDMFVEDEVSAIIEGINGSGRFGATTKETGKRGRFAIITEDVKTFISENAAGLERLGAARDFNATAGLGYRSTDESGDETFPLFQRKQFGEPHINWDNG